MDRKFNEKVEVRDTHTLNLVFTAYTGGTTKINVYPDQ